MPIALLLLKITAVQTRKEEYNSGNHKDLWYERWHITPRLDPKNLRSYRSMPFLSKLSLVYLHPSKLSSLHNSTYVPSTRLYKTGSTPYWCSSIQLIECYYFTFEEV